MQDPEAPLDLADYDFDLPPEQIAQQPSEARDGARLLHLSRAEGRVAGEYRVPQLGELLREGDLLVDVCVMVLWV